MFSIVAVFAIYDYFQPSQQEKLSFSRNCKELGGCFMETIFAEIVFFIKHNPLTRTNYVPNCFKPTAM